MSLIRKFLVSYALICVAPVLVAAEPGARTTLTPSSLIAVVDVEANLALIPEGTIVPSGTKIFFCRENGKGSTGQRLREKMPCKNQLVFGYAPAAAFEQAHRDIELARPEIEGNLGLNGSERLSNAAQKAPLWVTGQPVYVYFPDGSLHYSRVDNQDEYLNEPHNYLYVSAGTRRSYATLMHWGTFTGTWNFEWNCSLETAGGECGYWRSTPAHLDVSLSADLDRTVSCRYGDCSVSYSSVVQYDVP